jgi:release factor glutamine methyltransferase
MSETESWTIGRLLQWTTKYLADRGSSSARLDAEVLLAHARGCRRIELYTAFDEPASEQTRLAFRELVRRRAEGTPVAYLVGRREFYSLSFRVSPDVLIPRPETEFLVIALTDHVKTRSPSHDPIAIADVGTGSGILAVCAARHVPNCRVTASDISPAALTVARANAADHAVAEQIEFIEGDLLTALPAQPTLDFVISNPPYVTTAEMAELPAEVRDFEPRGALEAGPKGTEVIERLAPQAAERLRPSGWLLMEVSPMIEAAVVRLLQADPRWELRPTFNDLAGLPRVVQARRSVQ